MDNVRIDGARLWASLMDMARIGPGVAGGNNRQAGSDADGEGRNLFRGWCEAAGLKVTVDQVGNMFARRPGRRADLPPVVVGSHLDTQPTGGKFDGVLGVLAALELVRTLNDHAVETEAPIEVVNWTNEEGSRFAPAMMGSAGFAGIFTVEHVHGSRSIDGSDTMGAALGRIGYLGDAPVGGRPVKAYFELHIEQGPILEAEEKTIGVVTDVQGVRWSRVEVQGRAAHAGTTPMASRADALVAASRMIVAIDGIGRSIGPAGRATVGIVEVRPGSTNVVPDSVSFTVDMRHPEAETLARMDAALHEAVARLAGEGGTTAVIHEVWYSPPVAFDPGCVALVRQAAEAMGYPHRDMISGAGHDAVYMARLCPTSMVFVPCEKGISHNEAENILPEHAAAGCEVLMRAAVAKANEAA